MRVLPVLGLITFSAFGQLVFAQPAFANPYDKWLNEDVAYIITDEETRTFKRLTTDQERQMFIADFWNRRDPDPSTAVNEAKDEYYRRIAYANQRFASGVPGWKTDRGRIYIVFGPPEEIESYPVSGNGHFAYEAWRYRKMEGIGENVMIEFVDATRTGEYRMSFDPNEKKSSIQLGRPASPADVENQKKIRDRFTRRSN